MLHSGSRGVGNAIGNHFIELARKDMQKHFINLPNKDLAYLVEGTEHFDDYWFAVGWAQRFNSSWRYMKKMCDDPEFIDWQFHMKKMGTPTETINYFFRRNLFSTLNNKQFAVISGYLKSHIEGLIGELTSSQQGYIRPPNKYLPTYVQHWQHLYLKGKDAEILITFEANT